VPDATVRLGAHFSPGIFEGTTDAQGRFQVGSQSPGKTVISARAKGFGPVVSEIVITADMPEVELSLNAATVFRGRVVDPDGNPLSDVWVSVDQAPTFDSRDLAREVAEFFTRTDAEGRWSWDSGPDRSLTFTFSKEGFSERSRLIQPGPNEVTVTLDLPRVVEGIVLDSDSGDPVPRFRLAPQGSSSTQVDARDFDSADGRFSISLDKDHYRAFEVTSPTHEPSFEPIPASDNGRVQMTIRLKKGEEFAGTVVDPTGRPVPGATVVLFTPRQAVILVGTRLAAISDNDVQVADGDGSFKLNPVRGPQGIVAAHDTGFARVSVEEFRASGRIVLLPWGRVEGTYQGRVDASGFTGLNVLLFAGAGGISRQGLGTSPQVAQGGSFTIENVPPGRHQLHRRIPLGPTSAGSSFLEDFEVRSGETTTLDIRTKGVQVTGSLRPPEGVDFSQYQISGHIRSPSPIPQGLSAEARQKLLRDPAVQQALSPRYSVEVRPDGSVSAEDVLPGQYEIWVFLVRQQGTQVTDNWLVRQQFVVPEGAASPAQLGNLVPIQQPLKPINSQYVPLPRGP
jgi:protocatechuate 3,4-dioxygenase beta subunit